MYLDKHQRIWVESGEEDGIILGKIQDEIKRVEIEAKGLKEMSKGNMMLKLLAFKQGKGVSNLSEVSAASKYRILQNIAEELNILRKKYSPNSVNFVLEDW